MVGKAANAPLTAFPVNGSCMAAICGLGHHRAERQEPPPLNLRDAMIARSTLRSKNRIQFDPIHVKQLELAVIPSREACCIHSGRTGGLQ